METYFIKHIRDCTLVLIVPCGMETRDKFYFFHFIFVLIVPCGMETRFALLGDKIAWSY